MKFTLPTTKDEMYSVLQEIFHYYRVSREGYAEVSLEPLSLQRLSEATASEDELSADAEVMVKAAKLREKASAYAEFAAEEATITSLIQSEKERYAARRTAIETDYSGRRRQTRIEAQKRGLYNSTSVIAQLAEIDAAKSDAIAAEIEKNAATNAELEAKSAALAVRKAEFEARLDEIYEAEKSAKLKLLKSDAVSRTSEIKKYNAAQSEKEQRYKNQIKQTNESLRIKFLSVRATPYGKDELVDMGYYADVLDCVCGYYDTLATNKAYYDIIGEKKLMIYLDDYYEETIYMYKQRAGI